MSATEEAVIALEREWPHWQVWTVHTWDGHERGITWCARRRDDERRVLNAHTASELAEYLAEAESPAS